MKKYLKIFLIVFVGVAILGVGIFVIISATSKKLVCTSSSGDITLMYNDKKITGFTAQGFDYSIDEQNKIVEQMGMEKYLEEFSNWFSSNTTGSCTKK